MSGINESVYQEVRKEINSTRIKCQNILEEIWEILDVYFSNIDEQCCPQTNYLSQSFRKVKTVRNVLEKSLSKFPAGETRNLVIERGYDDIFKEIKIIGKEICNEMEFPGNFRRLESFKREAISEENYEEAGRIQKEINTKINSLECFMYK